jgi:hypothetical protein
LASSGTNVEAPPVDGCPPAPPAPPVLELDDDAVDEATVAADGTASPDPQAKSASAEGRANAQSEERCMVRHRSGCSKSMAVDDPYVKTYPSPSGAWLVRTVANEMKMSHWVEQAVLLDASGAVLFDFGSSWSADTIRWIDADHVAVDLRRYPGDRSASLEVDVPKREITVFGETKATWSFEATARWMR